MHTWCVGRLKIVASDTTQPRPSQTFQTRNDFIPNPGPNEPPIAIQASTDALPAQLRTATRVMVHQRVDDAACKMLWQSMKFACKAWRLSSLFKLDGTNCPRPDTPILGTRYHCS